MENNNFSRSKFGPEGDGQFVFGNDAEIPEEEPQEIPQEIPLDVPLDNSPRNNPDKPFLEMAWQTASELVAKFLGLFNISEAEFKALTQPRPDPQMRNMILIFLVGVLLTPITLTGVLLGWIRSYMRLYFVDDLAPQMVKFKPIVRLAMILGAIAAWVIIFLLFIAFLTLIGVSREMSYIVLIYLATNIILSAVIWAVFKKWWRRIDWFLAERKKFGSARFARLSELEHLKKESGFYVGGDYKFSDRGHLLTVAGTRGGKGTNLIIPNLLGLGGYTGSWVVIDPKGENAAITARYQKEQGKRVVILNPWELLHSEMIGLDSYNPLDILADKESLHLIDDVEMIAEMILPAKSGEKDPFFTDAARSIISGLLLYLVVTQDGTERHLNTLWNWVRMTGDNWQNFLAEMRSCDDELYGETICNSGNELVKHSESPETFASIMSHVLNSTDFIKSPPLKQSLQSGFDPYSLADGNTVVYIVIPADKLKSHYRWLRLVVTSLMRAVVRKPKNRVAFLLDEFAALGYLPEIETALSTYAGYNITVWPILQSLIQLKNNYGNNWESFVGNTAVRHFFSINDNFSADYVSKAIGSTSHITQSNKKEDGEANQRPLVTSDEVRRHSGSKMFAFIGSHHPTFFEKRPYYEIDELKDRFDKNPYIVI